MASRAEAFREKHGLQCVFCTPGMVMRRRVRAARKPEADPQQKCEKGPGKPLSLHRLPNIGAGGFAAGCVELCSPNNQRALSPTTESVQ